MSGEDAAVDAGGAAAGSALLEGAVRLRLRRADGAVRVFLSQEGLLGYTKLLGIFASATPRSLQVLREPRAHLTCGSPAFRPRFS